VQTEVATIGKRLSATTLLNQAFLAHSFEQELGARPYKIVHIASHGVFGATAEESYVLSYDTKIDMNKLEELFKIKRTQPEAVELLTLSACSTAAGDDRAPLGLAGVALKSGARSSIASLWSVSDAATADLISDTYAELQNAGMTKASALRNAQVRMLRGDRFRHPVYWAPFLLIGNWL
jgi:CHAT domain-containing protein